MVKNKATALFLTIMIFVASSAGAFTGFSPFPGGGGGSVSGEVAVSDAAYDADTWNNDALNAPSKNAVRDKFEALHAATTLAVSAQVLMDLTGQAISLDAQTANYVFSGPTTGAAAAPTFRALVAGDIPDISSTYQVKSNLVTSVSGASTDVQYGSAKLLYDQLALKLNATALDDTKGNGDTTYVWSADKTFDQFALKQNLDATLTAIAALTLTEGCTISATGADAPVVIAKGLGGYLYRMNAGATAPEWFDGTTVLQPLDADLTALAAISGVRGDIIYYGAAGWTKLAKGTSGYVLTIGANDPAWAASTGSGDLKADGTVPLTAAWDMGNFDVEAKSFKAKKASGVAGAQLLYEANALDENGTAWMGPASRTSDLYLQHADADPAANQFMLFPAPTAGTSAYAWQTYGNPIAVGTTDLGSAAAEWGDLYLKDGAVIKGQADQSATLTSSAGKWTANALGVSGAFTPTGTVELGDAGDDVNVNLTVNATDGHYSGVTITRTVKTGSAAEAYGQAMFVNSSGELEAADADVGSAAALPAVGLLVTAGEGASKKLVISGTVTETDWNWTPGAILYVSADPATTTGLTATRPSTSGHFIQRVGVALSADTILVQPSLDVGTAP